MNKTEILERIEDGAIQFVAVIEVLGKPKEHIVEVAKDMVDQIQKDERFDIIESDIKEPLEAEGTESLFSLFCEIEILAERFDQVFDFAMNYMPASLEIIEPENVSLRTTDANGIVNDFVSKVHETDSTLKNKIQEGKLLAKNLNIMILNTIKLFLRFGPANAKMVSQNVGISEQNATDFLEKLVTDKAVTKSGDMYQLQFKKQ
ncbi:MAG: hypothetical protein ACMXYA_01545 [Candidatus Woesearchaeota archaeon]